MDNEKQMMKYTFIVTKACALAPTKNMNLLGVDLLVDPDYQQHVQSFGNERIHIMRKGENGWQPKNNRTVRAVTQLVGSFNITIQNQCSVFPIDVINADP